MPARDEHPASQPASQPRCIIPRLLRCAGKKNKDSPYSIDYIWLNVMTIIGCQWQYQIIYGAGAKVPKFLRGS